ncbi:MAG: aminotransferase class III-fold pyridoxal phosphate-dependent enzyme [Deltaproteobacteria bacterium]|nr:aminotransferase class III-fold pyridoxal phosphate-dependent enzyme [Deltaproteobacteria bacterium]
MNPTAHAATTSPARTTSSSLELLEELRDYGGERVTRGLPDEVVSGLVGGFAELAEAIEQAAGQHRALRADWPQLGGDEKALVEFLQEDYVNFYTPATVNPFVPLAAVGPWIVTSHGAVIHDNGGYGMLGMGHAPKPVLNSMAKPWVQANVMTPSFSQKRLANAMLREVGHARADGCPFDRFLCLNSGSEAVTVALRISDINARQHTAPGGRHEGKVTKMLVHRGAFHGRTGRAAQASHSTRPKYDANLLSFSQIDNLIVVEANDITGLQEAFAEAERNDIFIETMLMEPVMGEGNPGLAVTRAYYDAARELTKTHGSLLIVDSIQAGLRATGCLSIVDYPGFEDCEGPDLETWSKAMNAGQYPLSVLGANTRAAELYVKGVYGNTMTTNPRALEVAVEVLDRVTPELRQNIRNTGVKFLQQLEGLSAEFPGMFLEIRGTGLLFCAEMDPEKYPVVGFGGLEEACRKAGIGVIHGGRNALRFTPHFAITDAEIDLVIGQLRTILARFYAA